MANPPDCLFCKIIDRKIPSQTVYETDKVLGFKDVNPQAPVHVLLVPKTHLEGVHEIGVEHSGFIEPLVMAANQVAQDLGIGKSGYRLVINCKKEAGQTVDHLHLHLLGGRRMNWPPG